MSKAASRLLVTGATGFVGQPLCAEATRRGLQVFGAVRSACELPAGVEPLIIGAVDGETDWAAALRGVDAVIHLAARVHVMKEAAAEPLAEFLKANLHGTANLAMQAAHAGVKRFVYVSSIKVNGEATRSGCKITEDDAPAPQEPYGISKWQAEQALHRIAGETGLEIVIVRPPLAYGANVKGNFAQMLKMLAKRLPLPLASAHNQRSLVYVENLVDGLIACATLPAAAGKTYLISDGEDISTPDLLQRLGAAMGCPAKLFPCPHALLKLAGRLTGKSAAIERLLGSLQIDSGKIRRELGWKPPHTLQQGLQATAEWYRRTHRL